MNTATRLLVLGSGGFIGGHTVSAALRRPETVLRLARRGTPATAPAGARVQTVRADLSEPASLRGLCRGVDALIHCASLVEGTEEQLRTVNDTGTRLLIEEALRSGVRRIVYVSTASVYG
ncbi:NAD-dependent epimerase/dehydratase family protein, partial [Streptomyces sp. NPDC057474]|uniref:NAD-dependent epimerase/dehydratase family protein n=1 Tax=Streptomyces sp. NPDC057474 TaxID=3346144 RepID=UPI00367DCC8E